MLVSAVSVNEACIIKSPGIKLASFAYSLMPNALAFYIIFHDLRHTAQQPPAELSPPPPVFNLSSSYSKTEPQFPRGSAALLQSDCISSQASFLFCDVILISRTSPVSSNCTAPGQSCLESCCLFPSSLMNKL